MLIHLSEDIRPLIKLSFNTSKLTRDLDALSVPPIGISLTSCRCSTLKWLCTWLGDGYWDLGSILVDCGWVHRNAMRVAPSEVHHRVWSPNLGLLVSICGRNGWGLVARCTKIRDMVLFHELVVNFW
jgi:hypothetical protein